MRLAATLAVLAAVAVTTATADVRFRLDRTAPAAAARVATPASAPGGACAGKTWCAEVVVTNGGDAEVAVDVRDTPLEGFVTRRGALRAVDDATGEELEYAGPLAKRLAAPAEERHLVRIRPGQAVAAAIDLSEAFVFEAGRSYTVTLEPGALGAAHRATSARRKDTRGHSFVAGATSVAPHARRHAAREPEAESRARTARYGAIKCSSSQQSTLDVAVRNVATGLATAYDEYIVQGKCQGTDFREYFGFPTYQTYRKVSSTLQNGKTLLAGSDFSVDCSLDPPCADGIFAFVYPTDRKHVIYTCNVFWSPQTSVDVVFNSKPGTLLHEATHFNDVGGTDDHAYGPDACRNLAQTDTSKATTNADSYEYFMEFIPDAAEATCNPCVQSSSANTCSSCTVITGCGFCNATRSCAAGDGFGPYSELCASDWLPDGDCETKDAGDVSRGGGNNAPEEVGEGVGGVVLVGVLAAGAAFLYQRCKKGGLGVPGTQSDETLATNADPGDDGDDEGVRAH